MTRQLRRQLFPVALTVLTIPFWWFTIPTVNPDSPDAGPALAQLRRNSQSSGFTGFKANRDMRLHGSAYARLIVRACNEPESTWGLWSPFTTLPREVLQPLAAYWPKANNKLRCTIAENVGTDFDHVGDNAAVLEEMLADPGPGFQDRAIIAISSAPDPMPSEILALTRSSNPHVRNAVRLALGLRPTRVIAPK